MELRVSESSVFVHQAGFNLSQFRNMVGATVQVPDSQQPTPDSKKEGCFIGAEKHNETNYRKHSIW